MLDAAPAAVAARSLDEFFAQTEVRAFCLANVALGDREEALDCVQDAMERMLGYRDRPASEWTPLFWSILRRRLTDRYRRRAVQQRLLGWLVRPANDQDDAADGLDAVPDSAPDPMQRLDDERAMTRLSHALRHLPTRQREAFLLRVLQGLDVASTAQAMGCGDGSVKTHLSRAMATLRTQLEDWR
ncbi:MAG: RNA polymerase sigma factor [Lysobacterales bacterium CG17_big_fil_post_rev_8_21_14_2_50_64_11]|nr:MAG: RNA polymerase sigma factor [Xanthomonadales bacterium CG17_big_fil_post_rev_8_21_14_2_50_64_11]PIX60037.1 MAG: RNA polymerase sigma factor [Xanthomonadales bacterium CG_4_10_14_3_um_filter_64_11]